MRLLLCYRLLREWLRRRLSLVRRAGDLWGEEDFKACGDPARCQARLLAARWRAYRERNPYKRPSSVLAARIALGEETRRVASNQNEVQASD